MKRILAVILAFCFMLICSACAENAENETPKTDGTQTDITAGGGTEDPGETEQPGEDEKEITEMYLYINGNKLEVTLAENKAVAELIDILKRNDIIYTANDYGGFEKVGNLGHALTTGNSQITTQPGDVILYSGNQIVLFYGSNTWSYTRLGRINGYSADELKALLGAGKGGVEVRISLK